LKTPVILLLLLWKTFSHHSLKKFVAKKEVLPRRKGKDAFNNLYAICCTFFVRVESKALCISNVEKLGVIQAIR
jgi:hypothetical protein